MSEMVLAQPLALGELDERYSGFRLQATAEARQAMIESLRRYGQLSPVVVWLSDGAWVLIDGFKRLEAARQLPELTTLAARPIEADRRTAKAAVYGMNQGRHRIHLLEEAWIVCSLVREEGLTQPEAARLLGHNKSWVSRRLALLEDLCPSAREDLSLGLLSPSMARQLTRLPVGNQESLLAAIRRDDLSVMEVKQVVDLLLGSITREQIEFVLSKPRQAAREANGGLARGYDPRLSFAGNRISRRLGSLLDSLSRMENWLRHSGRAELSPRDGRILRGGFERLARDARSVADLSEALAGEVT